MEQCFFCSRYTYDGSKTTLIPDADHPSFGVCARKNCARERAKMGAQERLKKYEVEAERRLQEQAARQARDLEWKRQAARESRFRELRHERTLRFGENAVVFAESLLAGELTLEMVWEARDAALSDDASVESLNDAEVDALVDKYDQRQKAWDLKARRVQKSNHPNHRITYGIDSAVFGVHVGKLSPGHAEVRRQVAAAHDVAWTEANLPSYGGVQSWFTANNYDSDVCPVLMAVASAETQPIVQAQRCHMCGKDAGLDYTSEEHREHSHYTTIILCTRPKCVVQRDRVVKRTQKYSDDRHGLVEHLLERESELRHKKFKPVSYPAPGALPIAAEDQARMDRYQKRLAEQERERLAEQERDEAERAAQAATEATAAAAAPAAAPPRPAERTEVRMSASYSYLEKLKARKKS